MNSRKIIFVMLLVLNFVLNAQNELYPSIGDHITLRAGDYQGTINWQTSNDNKIWSDVTGIQSVLEIEVESFPTYYRFQVVNESCNAFFSETISVLDPKSVESYLWSDPNTWGGEKPKNGDVVTIPIGRRIILDENTPELGGLIIEGVLEFDRKNLQLTSEYILINGLLEVGSEKDPFMQKAIITLTGTDIQNSAEGMGTRGIVVVDGQLELHGLAPNTCWTKIDANAPENSTSIELIEDANWNVGDEIVIAPTDYYQAGGGKSITQKTTITAINSETIAIEDPLNAFRWGLLQYATTNGMSLTEENMITPPVPDTESTKTPLVLDERAEVGNLTRNIVIQAPNDHLWISQGFGAHTMIMPGSVAHVEGVEFRRGGQRGLERRYPFHWHMLSYNGTQTYSDAQGQYIRHSTINSSANRGIVIHGTNGVDATNNIIYDIQGHGIFTEDAVERRNKISGNLVLFVRNPPFGTELKQHEQGELGSSGYWISNPDNILINNVAVDCETFGFWLAFTTKPWGLSSSVLAEDGLLINPSRTLFGVFDGNVSHSNNRDGIMIDNVENDDSGNVTGHQYTSTIDGREPSWPYETVRRFSLARYVVWKNGDNGIWDRASAPDNFEIVSADNCGRYFAGAGNNGVIERSLVIGTSLNHMMNGTGREALGIADFYSSNPGLTESGFATYHSTFDMKNNILVNFPLVPGERSGAFATEDYYIRPVEKGHIRNSGNLLVNSHAGYKESPQFDYFTLASAMWDPYGIWGPMGNYLVYDNPFITHGKVIFELEPGSGGVSVEGPFYGFEGFVLHGVGDPNESDPTPPNQPYLDLMGLHVIRYDSDLNEVGVWEVSEGQPNTFLNHMRDFVTSPDGVYELTFPQEDFHPTDFQMNVENMLDTDDTQVIGIQFDGSLNPIVRMQAYQFFEDYGQENSLQAVRDSQGATYWQDKSNNRVWIKLRGGVWRFWTDDATVDTPSSDELLYETTQLRIFDNSI